MAIVVSLPAFPQTPANASRSQVWYFAVSGDSRNCGDVVMPAIARKAGEDGALFYWHLGDYRAIYDFDQDFRQLQPNATIIGYETSAWKDFIEHQLKPFGNLPIRLALGNHETIPPKTRADAIAQFADWYVAPDLQAQRLRDDPNDHVVKAYYHWIQEGVDFITLDNASGDQFDAAQRTWFAAELQRASQDREIRTVVVGMHEALPDSLSAGHSMNESPSATRSGREVYQELVDFRKHTHKNVYVLASHSHFLMENIYNTRCRRADPDSVLPGWIVGTAGAVRYRLPLDLDGAGQAKTDVYGYLLGAVSSDGTIQFQFRLMQESDVPEEVEKNYSKPFVQSCFRENASTYVPEGPAQPPNCSQ